MRKLKNQLAVVRQNQKPFGIKIKPPGRIKNTLHLRMKFIPNERLSFRIGFRHQGPARLVEGDIDLLAKGPNLLSFKRYPVYRRVGLCTKPRNHTTVKADKPFLDGIFGGTPRKASRLCQYLLQALLHLSPPLMSPRQDSERA